MRLLKTTCLLVSLICLGAMESPLNANPLRKPLVFENFTPKVGLSSDMVYAVAVQGEKVWLGTYAGGASLYEMDKKTWKAYTTKGEPMEKADDGKSINWKNLLPYNHVSVIVPDGERVWFGTYFYGFGGGGISYYDSQKNPPWKAFNTNNDRAKKVVSMAVDGDWFWVGSEKGLSLLDRKTEQWKLFYSTENGLSGNFVNSLLVRGDTLWMGTNGGISRFNKTRKSWKTYSQKDGLTETEIKSVAQAGEKMWAGGIGGSLFEYESGGDRWKKIEGTDPLKNGGINALVVVQNRVLVCRDNGVSLYSLPTGQWESISSAEGLLGTSVFAAAEDAKGLWFGTDRGASRLIMNR